MSNYITEVIFEVLFMVVVFALAGAAAIAYIVGVFFLGKLLGLSGLGLVMMYLAVGIFVRRLLKK